MWWLSKLPPSKKLLIKRVNVGGFCANKYNFIYGKRIIERTQYFFTKIEKRSS